MDGEREKESAGVCVCLLLSQRGGTRHPKRSFSRSRSHLVSPRFCPFFPFRPLFGRPVPLMPSLFSRSRTTPSPLKSQKTSTELSDEFGRVSSRNSARGAVTVPVKKDRNVEKTRTRTLSGVKGRAPGPVPNEEEIVIPDGSFFPLNLDPLGGEPASPSDSERGPYLHLSSFIIFLPHRHRHPSFPKRSVRSRAVLEIVHAVPWAPPSRVAGVPSSGLMLSPRTPNLGYPC